MLAQKHILLKPTAPLIAGVGAPIIEERHDSSGRVVRQIARYEVHVMSGVLRWTNFVRYREFHAVHGLLKKSFREYSATLPPKTILSGVGAAFVQERGRALGRWLTQAMRTFGVAESFEMRGFLAPRSDSEGDLGALAWGLAGAPGAAAAAASGAGDGSEGAAGVLDGGKQQAHAKHRHTVSFRGGGGAAPGGSALARAQARSARHLGHHKHSTSASAALGASSVGAGRGQATPRGHGHSASWVVEAGSAATPRVIRTRLADMARFGPGPILSPHDLGVAENKIFRLVSTVLQVEQQGLLKRSAVSAVRSLGVFLYQGTMSAQLGDWYKRSLSGDSVGGHLALVRELLWPGGEFMKFGDAWSQEEMWGYREELLARLMHASLPAAGAVVGEEEVGKAVYGLHFMLNCPAVL